MAEYETMLITSAKLDEEATTKLVGKFKTLIEANGTIDGVDEWGKRRLAYPINKEDDGIYTLIHFKSEADFPAELDRVYKITDGVLRSLIIAKVEGMPGPRPVAEEKVAAPAKAEEPKAEEAAATQPETAQPAAEEPKEEQEASE